MDYKENDRLLWKNLFYTHQIPIHPGGLQGPSWALVQTDAIKRNPFLWEGRGWKKG